MALLGGRRRKAIGRHEVLECKSAGIGASGEAAPRLWNPAIGPEGSEGLHVARDGDPLRLCGSSLPANRGYRGRLDDLGSALALEWPPEANRDRLGAFLPPGTPQMG
jgi:hypothetical protein